MRGLGGEGRGWGLGGRGPCAGAAPPLRAAHSPPPAPSAAASSTSAPALPSLPRRQDGDTALDNAKRRGHTQAIVRIMENDPAYLAAQVLCTRL